MSPVSVLHPFAYGQVTKDNVDQSRTINIKILDYLPSQYGVPDEEVSVNTVTVETLEELISFDGKGSETIEQQVRKVTATFKDFLPANWLNRSANRISPPKVVVGQRVLLWRVGDSRQYYWEELDVDMRLKPDEHIVIAINNHNDGKRLDLDNAYFIELSTRDKRMRVITNRNNGEVAAFELDINGGEGILKMLDDTKKSGDSYDGNGLIINSPETLVHMKNIDGSEWMLDGKNITMNCEGDRTSTIGGTDTVTASTIQHISGKHLITGITTHTAPVFGTLSTWSIACKG